jgi:hypothetical protein
LGGQKEKLLESLPISKRGLAIREWDEGFEELQSIPHSFSFVFQDGGEPWSFYTDSEEEKVRQPLALIDGLFLMARSPQCVIVGLLAAR